MTNIADICILNLKDESRLIFLVDVDDLYWDNETRSKSELPILSRLYSYFGDAKVLKNSEVIDYVCDLKKLIQHFDDINIVNIYYNMTWSQFLTKAGKKLNKEIKAIEKRLKHKVEED